ncbi:TPA: hypothetical protein MHL12_19085 [Klebsiella pneumoniae]|uniref:hypothetical protein n=1 Tax=Klebsiella pneumoniae TaxID=573 RepID=UPI0011550DFB|nr:hypothetical protein [Klebsiella pneumoniae]HDS8393919.1 hypothetical protein [Klebsiella pneumoniae subsp. pneumoniae]EKX4124945.1 hypothetical protein [Klebsiella pneumoniae]MBK5825969.1 hypothetical protein [Klebsiella pneumoniae]MBS2789528.1 hypothetical protein [Klebsiella pneumoniae]MCD5897793.1 hypothetical protein [Klebsiella pneumoniae]
MAVPYRLRTQSGGESVKEEGIKKQFAILQINAVGCKRYLFLSNQQGTQKQKNGHCSIAIYRNCKS